MPALGYQRTSRPLPDVRFLEVSTAGPADPDEVGQTKTETFDLLNIINATAASALYS